jgi:hypothetical protein
MGTKNGRNFSLLFSTFSLISANVWEYFIFMRGAAPRICETTREKREKIVWSKLAHPFDFYFGAMTLDVTTRSRL